MQNSDLGVPANVNLRSSVVGFEIMLFGYNALTLGYLEHRKSPSSSFERAIQTVTTIQVSEGEGHQTFALLLLFSPLEFQIMAEENYGNRKNVELVDGCNRMNSSNQVSAKV